MLALLVILGQASTYCGGGTCVGGRDGGFVNIGDNVIVSKNFYSRPQLSPVKAATSLSILGNMSGDGGTADVLIGSANTRVGPGPIVGFMSGASQVGRIDGSGNLVLSGSVTSAGTTSSGTTALATGKIDVLDAGVARINGALTVTGTVRLTGALSVGTCTLGGESPSVCTDTVTAGTVCLCAPVGASAAIAAGGCAVGLSDTTLTVTGPNAATNVVNWFCF